MNYSIFNVLLLVVVLPFVSLNAQESAKLNYNNIENNRNEKVSLNEGFAKSQNLGTICSKLSTSWVKTQYSETEDVVIYKNCIDKLGNSFICGNLRTKSNFYGDFLLKYDVNGKSTWNSVDDPDFKNVYNIAADNLNNFVVVGDYSSYTLIKKYNSSNILVWQKSIANSGSSPLGVATDNQNNIYIVGYFKGSASFDNINITSSTTGDMYICKLDVSGKVLWVKNINVGYIANSGEKFRLDLSIDQSNNLYICSEFKGNISFLGTNVTNKGNKDIFIAKVNANGNLGWINTYGSTADDIGISCSVDNSGNVFATGYYSAKIDQNPFYGSSDVFVAKINSNGTKGWFKSIGGNSDDYGWSCVVDNLGGCLVTGEFKNNLYFDNKIISNALDNDGFLLNLGNTGNLNWIEKISGTDYQRGNNLASFGNNEYLLSGAFYDAYTIGKDTITGTGSYLNGFNQRIKISTSTSPNINQNIAGKWTGNLKQNVNGDFYYEMDLKYDAVNNKVTGTTFITLNEDFCLFEIEGYTIGERQVFFNELKIIKEKTSGGNYWCLKQGILNLCSDNSNILLNGDWVATNNCYPGTIAVTKVTPTIKLYTSNGLDFGSKLINSTNSLKIDLKNTGNAVMIIDSIRLPSGYTGDWSKNAILPNTTQTLTITFKPIVAKNYDGNIAVFCNITEGSNLIPLKGVGITQSVATISLSSSSIDFGYANIGTAKSQTIEISNIGNKDINISFIKLLNGYKLNMLPVKLIPNEKKSLNITFYPTEIKDYNGKIIFASDATNGNSEINCTGKGIIHSPAVSCDPQIVKENENIKITGEYFLPNTSLKLTVYNKITTQKILTQAITSDPDGKFNYTFQLSAAQKGGDYNVAVNEEVSNGKSTICWFQFLPTVHTSSKSSIEIIRPFDDEISETGEINIKFTDILVVDRLHPIFKKTFEIGYSYKILYRAFGNSNWVEIKNFDFDFGKINTKIELNFTFKNIPVGKYEFKIIDNFNANNFKISSVFEVISKKQNKISVDFVWDKSYDGGINYAPIKGVAAEGVSRFYIDINPKLKAIKSIKCLLFDNLSTQEPENLGKLMITSEQGNVSNLKYTDEANEAKSISKDIKDLSQGPFLGKLRLWYIAPDDFASNTLHKDSSYRTVFLKLNFILEDNSNDSLFIPIKIVRPPLMLVHGWNSDPTTWESLRYVNKTNDTIYFKDDQKFINVNRLIKIFPDKSFDDNSKLLLEDQDGSSFNSVIGEMRAKGFVCNQVDYVCHSMGGAIVRNIYSKYYDSFYRNSESNKVNNYGKGFINKYITINTPHYGSPWGDFLSEYIPQFNGTIYDVLIDFFVDKDAAKSIIVDTEKGYEASMALKNLGTKEKFGGVHFTENNTKAAHFISSDIVKGLGSLPDLPNEIFVLNDKLKQFLEIENEIVYYCIPFLPQELQKKIGNAVKDNFDPFQKFVTRFNLLVEAYSKTDFCLNSDLVVSTESQTAGNLSSLVNIPKYVSHFEDNTTISPSYSHITFKDKVIAGNRVFELLNSKVNSELFTQNITKTPSLISIDERDEKVNVINYLSDTSKIKIVTPSNNSIFKVGENIVVKVAIKDTSNSFRVVLNSQYYNFEKYQIEDTCIFVLPIKGNKLGVQKMVAEISYFTPTGLDIYADTIAFSVVTDSKIVNFEVLPKYNLIKVGENINLNLKVYYQNFTTSWYDTSKMKITIESPDLLTYQHKNSKVKPLKEGSTYLAFEYENLKDTIYFLIEGKITRNEEVLKTNYQVNLYPNPTSGILKLEIENTNRELVNIFVHDQIGKLINSSKEEISPTNNIVEKDFSTLISGLYFITIKGNTWTKSLKFVKI